ILFTRRFFRKARLSLPRLQHGINFRGINARIGPEYREVIEQVRALGNHPLALARCSGDRKLHRFLSHLLGDLGAPLRIERCGVGAARIRAFSRRHGGIKPVDTGQVPLCHRALSSSRTAMPASRIASFASRMVNSPKWKIDAASTAVAWPSRMPSARCSSVPTPPEAITGIFTASATARVSGMLKPDRVPSR